MTKAESIVQQNAKECLDKAESVYQVFSAPGSSRSSISAPFNSVFSQRHYPAEPGSEGPSAGGSATPVDSLSVDDELEYLTDKAYADIINDCVCDVRRYRLSKDLDSAAVALYEAINYSQKRKRHHNTEFHNERDMKMTLADMHMDRQYYSAASEIFKELLEEEQHRSQNAWVLNCRLAKAYLEDLRLDLAVSHVHQANTIRLKTSSKRDPLIIETLNLLQQIHSANNQPREALLFEREALQHRLSELDTLDPHLAHLITDGGDPRDVLRFLHNLGEDAPEHDAIALKTFHHSVALNRLDIAKELFDAFPVIRKNTDLANELGVRPVMCAVQWGHENMVEWLLETENCNVNARTTHDSSQNTALMVAAGRLDLSIVMMLLAHGANPMDRDCHGRTALNHALAVPSLDNSTHSLTQVAVVSTILSAGKPEELLREKCTALKTALHEAVEAGNASIVALLVEKGADLEARDVSGRTPLLAAIDAGKPDAVNALLTAGADWQTKDDLGRTTISAARKPVGGSKKMLMMLKNKRKETPRAVPHASTHGNGDDMRRMTPSVSSATSERNSQERRPSTQSTRKSITSTGPPLAAPPNRRLSIFTEGGENVLDRQSVLVRTSSRVDSAAEISIEDEIRNSLRRGRCKSGKAASVLSTTSTATKWGSKLGTLMRDFERRG